SSAGSPPARSPPTSPACGGPPASSTPSAPACTTGTPRAPASGRTCAPCAPPRPERLEEGAGVREGQLGEEAVGGEVGALGERRPLDGEPAPLTRGPPDHVGGVVGAEDAGGPGELETEGVSGRRLDRRELERVRERVVADP